jgi:hypothetical protein
LIDIFYVASQLRGSTKEERRLVRTIGKVVYQKEKKKKKNKKKKWKRKKTKKRR